VKILYVKIHLTRVDIDNIIENVIEMKNEIMFEHLRTEHQRIKALKVKNIFVEPEQILLKHLHKVALQNNEYVQKTVPIFAQYFDLPNLLFIILNVL